MTNDKIEAIRRCARVFTTPGTPEGESHKEKVARHGHFCDTCFYRTDRSLRGQGALVEHILTLVGGIVSKVSDGAQVTKGDPPLPFNVEAFHDANEVYSRLVYWCRTFGEMMSRQAPGPAVRAWRTDSDRIVGLPNDVPPADARYAVGIMALWLAAHLEDIDALPDVDAVSYFNDEMADTYRLAAKWPAEDAPVYAPTECSREGCDGKIAIYPPTETSNTGNVKVITNQRIVCEKCGTVYTEDQHEDLAAAFSIKRKAEVKEIIKAHRISERLAKKYA